VLNDATLAAAVVWLFALILASLTVRRWAGPWIHAHPVLAVAGAAAIARVVPALVLDRGLPFDIEAHWWIGSLALAGRDVYIDPLAANRYPYPPILHEYLSAALVWLSHGDRALFLVYDKLAPALCGVGIALAVRAIACRLGRTADESLRLGLLYAVNPLPVLVTAYHGQFEEIPVLGIALALLVLAPVPGKQRTSNASARAMVLSALLLGLAISYKLWPALFLPPLLLLTPRGGAGQARARAMLGWLRAWVVYGVLALAPLLVLMNVYEVSFEHSTLLARADHALTTPGTLGQRLKDDHMLYAMLDYKGSEGFCWGYVSVAHSCWIHPASKRPNAGIIKLNGNLLKVALLLAALALLWRRRPLEGFVALPLVFYLFSPGWGPNYTVWVLPFAFLLSSKLALRYTVVVTPLVALIYLDSLYASFNHDNFSWTVVKPIEAALGLLAWGGVLVLLGQAYRIGGWRRREPIGVADAVQQRQPTTETAHYPVYGAQTHAR